MPEFLPLLSTVYYYALVVIATYFFMLSLANHYEMMRFTYGPEIFDGPLVSVLIPVRNEEKFIERCLNSLRDQRYQNYEILALNDNSTDKTQEILERMAREDDRIKIFTGMPLPDNWYGKPFALHQLTQKAKGEIYLFTDADTIHNPASISWAVTNIQRLKTDMVTGYIGQIFNTFGEIITVPLMFFLTGFVIPLTLNRLTRSSIFSAAIGQFIAIKRDVFNAIGGCESFKKKTSEDIYLSRVIKRKGYSCRFLNITEHISCRMFNGYWDAIRGIGKNVFDFLGKNTMILFFMILGVLFFLIMPLPLLTYFIITSSPFINHMIYVNLLYTLTWIFMFLGQRLDWKYGFLWPLIFLNLLFLASWSWYRTVSGRGFLWKDRKVI